MYPFKQKRKGNLLIREFSKDVDAKDLVWHRDKLSRTVKVTKSNGWKLQLDNTLPVPLVEGKEYFIESKVWHRVIKGKGNLIVLISEKNTDQNKDGENDFEDVKIARMLASGMSIEQIKKEFPELFKESNTMNKNQLNKFIKSYINERSGPKSSSGHLVQYSAPEGSKRDKMLDQTQADFKKAGELRKQGKTKQAKELEDRAYKRRDRMERQERKKNETLVKEMIASILEDENDDSLDEDLSASTKKSLDKKADARGLTRGSVYKEFQKGLAAYARSGSRKGMSAHQWAHARVNSATPSKSWAIVKKSKAKKK